MHDKHPEDDPNQLQKAIDLGYETGDVGIPVLLRWGAYLVVFFLITSVLAYGSYWLFITNRAEPTTYVFDTRPRMPDPTIPLVQPEPQVEIKDFRRKETIKENQVAHWTDGDGKTVLRMPISSAMKLVKERGLPAAKAAAGSTTIDGGQTPPPPMPVNGTVPH